MKRRLSEASSSTTKRHATGLGRIQGEDFGQRTPPIHEIIRNILQEYPSGQIFKVNTEHPAQHVLSMSAVIAII